MKALSHPRRVRAFRILGAAPEGLADTRSRERAGLTISTLNHHLRLMRVAGAVKSRRNGACVIHTLAPAALRPHLERMSDEAADAEALIAGERRAALSAAPPIRV